MNLLLGEAKLIAFVLVDTNGTEVAGLGTTFSVAISKAGGAFAAGTGTKAEIGSGWYSYQLTAAETDTEGQLAVKITGTGAAQQNLLYEVSGSVFSTGSGSYILTTAEAATVLRCETDDPNMLMLLPAVDAYIKNATGFNWASESPIREEAKNAARILLVRWHEDPGGMAVGDTLGPGWRGSITQLEAIAMRYRIFEGLPSAGYIYMPGAGEGDTVELVTGVQGVSGDQAANFETVISVAGYLQQTSGNNLKDKWFRAYIVPVGSV